MKSLDLIEISIDSQVRYVASKLRNGKFEGYHFPAWRGTTIPVGKYEALVDATRAQPDSGPASNRATRRCHRPAEAGGRDPPTEVSGTRVRFVVNGHAHRRMARQLGGLQKLASPTESAPRECPHGDDGHGYARRSKCKSLRVGT